LAKGAVLPSDHIKRLGICEIWKVGWIVKEMWVCLEEGSMGLPTNRGPCKKSHSGSSSAGTREKMKVVSVVLVAGGHGR
jgi:hypothetical protein